jgi:uncharacterized SAM-binding protein YcdF (DUF218 family)
MKFKKLIRIFILLTSGGFLFTSLHFYYNTFLLPQFLLRDVIAEPADAIIVPGVQFNGDKWSKVMQWRVSWSVLLYKKGLAKNIIYSGGAVYTPYTEAKIMAMYAKQMGVPEKHILVETKAEHTTENLYYSWQIAKEKGFRKIALATDPFQSHMITPYIKEFGLDVSLVPMVIPLLSQAELKDYEINSANAYVLDFISITRKESPEEREFYSKGGRVRELISRERYSKKH